MRLPKHYVEQVDYWTIDTNIPSRSYYSVPRTTITLYFKQWWKPSKKIKFWWLPAGAYFTEPEHCVELVQQLTAAIK